MVPTIPPTAPQPQIMRRARITFPVGTLVASIGDAVRAMNLALAADTHFALEYALTELVYNALRAAEDQEVDEPVTVDLEENGQELIVTVSDRAGGFDLSSLPYDFSIELSEVDLESDAFDEYRTRCGNRRFGMGLLTARAVVQDFELGFVGRNGLACEWRGPGSVQGTRIRFRLACTPRPEDRRGSRRRSVLGTVEVQDGPRARMCDLSTRGARLIVISGPSLDLGQEMSLCLLLGDGAPIGAELRARVVRVDDLGGYLDVGMEFVDLSEAERAALQEMVEKIETSSEPAALQKVQVELTAGE